MSAPARSTATSSSRTTRRATRGGAWAGSPSTTSRTRAARRSSSRGSATARCRASRTRAHAHEIHSVFAWDAGRRAYAVLVDNIEALDVDIVDISNPRKPKLIAEYDLAAQFQQILQTRPPNLQQVFHHDVIVKKIGARQIMLVSYWDGGYVKLDVTDPPNARYLADSDFANPDRSSTRNPTFASGPRGTGTSRSSRRGTARHRVRRGLLPDRARGGDRRRRGVRPLPGDRTPAVEVGTPLSRDDALRRSRVRRRHPVPARRGSHVRGRRRAGRARSPRSSRRSRPGATPAAFVVNNEGAADGCSGFRMAVQGGIPAFAVDRPTGFALFDRPASTPPRCRAGSDDLLPGVAVGERGRHGDRAVVLRRLGLRAPVPERTAEARAARHVRHPGGDGSEARLAATASSRCTRSRPRTSANDLAYLSYYAGGLRVIRIEERQAGRGRAVHRRQREQLLGRPGLPARRPGVRRGERHRLRAVRLPLHRRTERAQRAGALRVPEPDRGVRSIAPSDRVSALTLRALSAVRAVESRLYTAAVLVASILSEITEAITSAIGDYGLYAVFLLMLIDAVLPAASEVVMVYGGALASGAFAGQEVVLFGRTIEEGLPAYLAIALAGHDRLHDRRDRRLGDRALRGTAVPRAARALAPSRPQASSSAPSAGSTAGATGRSSSAG